jgi:hypothetical protein
MKADEPLLGQLYDEIEEHLATIDRVTGVLEAVHIKIEPEVSGAGFYLEFTFEDGQEPVVMFPKGFGDVWPYRDLEGRGVTMLVSEGRRFEATWGADESVFA